MSHNFYMLRKVFSIQLLLLLFAYATVQGQNLTTTPVSDATTLANMLKGTNSGITITGATYSGSSSNSHGSFSLSGGGNLGLSSGIILSTGDISGANGGKTDTDDGTENNTPGDTYLSNFVHNNTYDASVLEFNFTAIGNKISFRYVFASDEYQDFTCSSLNDAFAFLVSGPGISGVKNIALIPSTTTPVSINTVNNGTPGKYGSSANCPSVSTAYYNNSSGVNGDGVNFAGYTVVLTAELDITPCQEYHIKIVVADTKDKITDSGVMIQAGSLNITQPVITLTGTTDNKFCTNSSATLTAPTGYYSYQWKKNNVNITTDGTSSTYVAHEAGTYKVVVQPVSCDATKFTSDEITLTTQDPPVSTIAHSTTSLCASSSITLTAAALSGSGTYSWSNAATTRAINVTAPGTYQVTMTDGVCSVVSEIITVTGNNLLSGASKTDVHCHGGSDGTITLSPSLGRTPYTVDWEHITSGPEGLNLTGLAAGTYTAHITDADGCTKVEAVVIDEPVALAIDEIEHVALGSAGIDFASAGTPPYTVVWKNSSNAVVATLTTSPYVVTNLTAGNYTVYVTDANGCNADAPYTEVGGCIFTANISSHTNVSCPGLSDGAISIGVSDGNSPYTYQWKKDGVNYTSGSLNLSGLSVGNYQVEIIDDDGCKAYASQAITAPAFSVNATGTGSTCNGLDNGTLSAGASGGAAPLSYLWEEIVSGDDKGTTADLTDMVPGTYTVRVTDANGCILRDTAAIGQPGGLSFHIAKQVITCHDLHNGSAEAVITGGTPPYVIAWTGPSSFTASTASITGLYPGTYSVTVTDHNTCSSSVESGSASITLINPTELSLTLVKSTTVRGQADLTPSGGRVPYTYLWSNGFTGEDPSNLQEGQTYSVTVTDSAGCTKTASVNMAADGCHLAVQLISQQNVSCYNGTNGSFNIGITSGSGKAPYSYVWKNSASETVSTLEDASGLPGGNYVVTVTDSNGCQTSLNTSLLSPPAYNVQAAITHVACHDQTNGAITMTVTGSNASYTSYSWSGPSSYTASTKNITGLAGGSYTLIVTDIKGCKDTSVHVVTNPAALSANGVATPVACYGQNNGSINLTASGGWLPYTYSWTGSNSTSYSVEDPSGLAPAIYTLNLTDARGCTATTKDTITQPSAVLEGVKDSQTNLTCHGASTGSITAHATGGTSPYTYAWTLFGDTLGTATTISSLKAGVYTLLIQDARNCTASLNVTLTEPPAPPVLAEDNIASGCKDITPIHLYTDSISGATYEWFVKTGVTLVAVSPADTDRHYSPTEGGFYVVKVNKGGGCIESSDEFLVTLDTPPVTTLIISPNRKDFCSGQSFTLTSSYTAKSYLWKKDGVTIPSTSSLRTITASTGGIYTLVAKNRNCDSEPVVDTIAMHDLFTFTKAQTNVSCVEGHNGTASVTVTGAFGAKTYAWTNSSNTTVSTSNSASGLVAGTYKISITDVAGCHDTSSVVITQPTLTVTPTITNVSCRNGNNGSISLSISSSLGTCSVLWSTGSTSTSITGRTAGTYTAAIKCGDTCAAVSRSFTITQPDSFTVSLTPTLPSCYGQSTGSIATTVAGGTAPYTYLWTNAQTTANATSLAAGTYNVTVTDSKSCTATATALALSQPAVLAVSLAKNDPSCTQRENGTVTSTVTGGTAAYTYAWSNGSTQASLINVGVGTYNVTVTDSKGCVATGSKVLSAVSEDCPCNLTLTLSAVAPYCVGGTDGSINVNLTGGTAPYRYDWSHISGDNNGASAGNVGQGSYRLKVYDSGTEVCTIDKTVSVPDGTASPCNPPPCLLSATVAVNNVSCFGGADGSVNLTASGGTAPYKIDWQHITGSNNTEDLTNLTPGTYVAIVSDTTKRCFFQVTAIVNAPEQTRVYISNQNICPGELSTLTSSSPTGNLWSTGETTRSITVDTSGTYILSVGSCSTSKDTAYVFMKTDCDKKDMLCDPDMFPTFPATDSCAKEQINRAIANAQMRYTAYLEDARTAFREQYIAKCLTAYEDFDVSYTDREHHYTLYYYDQGGNLVRTIPPSGIKLMSGQTLDTVRTDRALGTRNVFTKHDMATTYTFNSLGQLTAQNMPDHRTMDIHHENSLTDGSGLSVDPALTITSTQFTGGGNGVLTAYDANGKGYIYNTSDQGKTWTKLNKIGTQSFLDIEVIDGSNAYVIGEDGVFFKSVNGGLTWTLVPTGLNADLKWMEFSDGNNGVVYDESGMQYVTTNGGDTWSNGSTDLQSKATGKVLTDIYHVSSLVAYATIKDQNKGYIYKTTNGGGAWTLQTNIRSSELAAIHLYAPAKAMAITRSGVLVSSADGGANWTLIPSHLPSGTAKEINFQSDKLGVVLTSDEHLYYTNNQGLTWNTAIAGITDITDIDIRKDNTGYAVTASHKLFKTVNGGINWTEVTNLPSAIANTLTTVSSTGSDNIYVVEGTTPVKIYARQKRGLAYAWYSVLTTGLPSAQVKGIHFSYDADGKDNIGTILYPDGSVYYTELAQIAEDDPDLPTNVWNSVSVTTDAGSTFQFVDPAAPEKGYLISNTEVQVTTDGGENWSSAFSNTLGGPLVGLSLFSSSGTITAVAAVNNGMLYYRPSTTWIETTKSCTAPALEGIAMDAATGRAYAVGLSGTVLGYGTLGTDWILQETDPAGTQTLRDVAIKAGSTNFVLAAGDNGSVLYTTTAGLQWNAATAGTTTFNAVACEGDQFYAAGNGGAIYTAPSTFSTFTKMNNTSVADLYTMEFKDGMHLAAGAKGKIFALQGTDWVCVTDADPEVMLASSFGDKTTGYAVGQNGTVLKTTDSGKKWTEINSVTSKTLRAVDFYDADHGIIAGDNGLLKYTDVGGTDKFKNATISATGVQFRSVQMVTDKIAVAVGELTGVGAKAYVSQDGGHSWTSAGISDVNGLNAVHFTDASFGFAVGNGGLVYQITPGGSTFTWGKLTTTSVSPVSNANLLSVHCIDRVTAYVGSTGGQVFKTINGGQSWQDASSAAASGDILSINFTDRTNGFVAGTGTTLGLLNDEKDLYSGKFWYDQLGRLILSQNAKQCNDDTAAYSYTLYDELGRIKEVGEMQSEANIKDFCTTGNAGQLKEEQRIAFMGTALKTRQVTRTYYDVAPFSVPGLYQDRLRTRVASVTYTENGSNEESDYDHASHYTYDIHGNVQTIVQDYKKMVRDNAALSSQQYKRIDYSYDLVSGNVNEVAYQKGEKDQYFHRYEYDADNRITNVRTSSNGVLWDKDAKYFYYDHGPLARTEIGDQKVQGMDYAYTIQGWIKGVNSETLNATRDMGNDANTSGVNQYIGSDAYGYSLNYFNNDYKSIGGTSASTFMASVTANKSNLVASSPGLYNGNIRRMTTAITNPNDGTVLPQMTAYRYDQLNRIKQLKAYRDINLSTNAWSSEASNNTAYEEQYTYDANGNIETLKRNGASGELAMDNLTYRYEKIDNVSAGANYTKNTNKLRWVDDSVTPTTTYDDINDQGLDNYEYDDIGNLVHDTQDHIDTIIWTVYGKVSKVIKDDGYDDLEFLYDASGNRIAKIVKKAASKSDPSTWETTWYTRDASGNVMATYQHKVESSTDKFLHHEQMLYGSTRLGMDTINHDLLAWNPSDTVFRMIGKKQFEGSNHLGNVLSVVTDRRVGVDVGSNGTIDYYKAKVLSSTDYYAFGMAMPDRSFHAPEYRYGFQGQEKDDELSGDYAFEYRIYDPRIGKFLSIDPLTKKYPHNSPFAFSENRVVDGVELEGLEVNLINQNKSPADCAIFQACLMQEDQSAEHVYSHGNPHQMFDDTKKPGAEGSLIDSPEDFDKMMTEKSEKWRNRGMDGKKLVVVLHSCRTGRATITKDGAIQPSIAQVLSKAFPDVIFVAPDERVVVTYDSKTRDNVTEVGPRQAQYADKNGDYNKDVIVDGKKTHDKTVSKIPGKWNVFSDGELVNQYRGEWEANGDPGLIDAAFYQQQIRFYNLPIYKPEGAKENSSSGNKDASSNDAGAPRPKFESGGKSKSKSK